MKFVVNLLLTALAVLVLANILPGASITDYFTAILVAFVLAILNVLVKPVLFFISIPITVVTLGLFLFVINAIIILLAGELVGGFSVHGFWAALLFSLCLSLTQSVIDKLIENANQKQ
ncbi:phage holin family protein [Capnocytophaga canimorsus]|uniref:Phage holin family protein n=1 Tax=Capnocytophaga canimorsus TaxID=28188 RepID=A0A0B7IAQ0_9FLAO|nr:phage holin family protein [Capnocytophaga canimorsus]ATA77023.1 phage holin family protein [Capnocytophaga canimorsus]ATA91605.1 phage holin family protein [Capnocytophaga canimorsus]ATA93759.1 phage holin family protein [Capnocytophaga canimorsus]PJI83841.1 putative membrane protein [Capnocytophaga canimorsus]WGU68603.1 phage holin family protein [Capnocytophaga canimorsus]